MKHKLFSSGNPRLDEWIGRAGRLQIENDALRAENLELRKLAFELWLEHFERLKQRISNEAKGEATGA